MNRWFTASSLPMRQMESNQSNVVLAYTKRDGIVTAYVRWVTDERGYYCSPTWYPTKSEYELEDVLFWMPLPHPPI